MLDNQTEQIFKNVLDACFKVHKTLGPGLLESAYEVCLVHELQKMGLKVRKQVALPVQYENIELDAGYRIDLLVEETVIVELKAVDELNPIHIAQVLTYLKLSKLKLGSLVNFNVKLLRNGIKRIIL
ncbi:GxxExxY protein [Algoriphagus machipongonensis]|uniref:GxxExxY protein n=1 Tax=Algoriphagus machipongonensis TaxID=388413 RepID=A3HRQ8_9BACT|nr:GxxExxY protein [Algoriphagus machipongonensis]EAZ82526.1 hypothetical protein ALPR1_09935 [Algoriphagus machipongonensis]